MKMELLTNATVVDDAIRFVANDKEQITWRTVVTEINHDNDMPFHLVNDEFQEQRQPADNKPNMQTTNQVF
jgi:hypothetical protein